MLGTRPSHGDRQPRRGHDRFHLAAHGLAHRFHGVGLRKVLEDLLLAPAEELGKDPVDDDGGQVDRGLVLHAPRELNGLVHGHFLGSGDDAEAGRRRVREDVEHPTRLLAD